MNYTGEDVPEFDPAEFEGDVDEVDPRGELDEVEPHPDDTGEVVDDDGLPAIDWRADFLDWFTAHFATVEVTGSKDGIIWCPEWWKHPEAIARLWALYYAHKQAWEAADTLSARSDWWHYHWDHHRSILLDAQLGPFRDCLDGHLSKRRNQEAPLVPVTIPPDDWTPPEAPAYKPAHDVEN